MDIELPEGLVFTTKNNVYATRFGGTGTVYPYTEDEDGNKSYTHSVSSNCIDGSLRVACISLQNENFTANSGNLFRCYVKASPYAKPGTYTINMTGLNLTANAGGVTTKYVPEGDLNEGSVTVGTSATVPVTINAANKYGTCILPFAVSELPAGLKAYKSLGINGDALYLQETTSLEAYTPYVLNAEAGYTGNFTGTVDASLYPEGGSVTVNGLTGILTSQEVTSGYILQNQGEGAKFYIIGSTPFSLPAGRCYLSETTSEARLRFEIVPTTNINAVTDDSKQEVIYNLLGQRVTTPQSKNIYISNKRGAFIQK